MFFRYYELVEIFAFCVCLVCFIRKKSIFNKWLLPLLLATIGVELCCRSVIKIPTIKYATLNIFTVLECLGYAMLLRLFLETKKYKQFVEIACICLLIFAVCNMLFGQGLFVYNQYTRVANCSLIISCSLLVLYQLIVSQHPNKSFANSTILLFTSAVFVFYTGCFLLYFGYSFLEKSNPKDASYLYKLINFNLNIVLYLLLSVALVIDFFSHKKQST